tara:strand:+ start:1211 stop:1318 length:108 start_codon:yes stop_codon:yes gene_type:complete
VNYLYVDYDLIAKTLNKNFKKLIEKFTNYQHNWNG